MIAWLWARFHPRTADRYLIALASGAVAGESLASASMAILGVADIETHWGGVASYVLVAIAAGFTLFVIGRNVYYAMNARSTPAK